MSSNYHNKGQRDASRGRSRSTPWLFGMTKGQRKENSDYNKGYNSVKAQKRK